MPRARAYLQRAAHAVATRTLTRRARVGRSAGARDNLLDIVVRVRVRGTVGTRARQAGQAGRLDREGLVVGHVPVEHVELGVRHPVERHLDARRREVVAARVDHEATPPEARVVGDVDRCGREREALRVRHDQLRERLDAAQRTPHSLRRYVGHRHAGRDLVRLVGVAGRERRVVVLRRHADRVGHWRTRIELAG